VPAGCFYISEFEEADAINNFKIHVHTAAAAAAEADVL